MAVRSGDFAVTDACMLAGCFIAIAFINPITP
jgi:hypothetical protein